MTVEHERRGMEMAKTLRKRFIEALIAMGETQVFDARSTGKHVKFTRAVGGFYYVGKSGSLRVGVNIANSIPVSAKFKNNLLGVSING